MPKIAIVGSRTLSDERVKDEILEYLHGLSRKSTTIISGGAAGVDQVAVLVAKNKGFAVIEILPNWSEGNGAGFKRNSDIVRECDEVLCIWDGKSKGCIDTVKKARAAGKPTSVVLMLPLK